GSPISRSTGSFRPRRRWSPTWRCARRRAGVPPVTPTCSCFPTLTAATSDTNWYSAWAVGRRSGQSSRDSRDPWPTCRGAQRPMILWTRRRSPSFKRGSGHELQSQEGQDGVVVVGVDGQLIVGNRQELKQKV